MQCLGIFPQEIRTKLPAFFKRNHVVPFTTVDTQSDGLARPRCRYLWMLHENIDTLTEIHNSAAIAFATDARTRKVGELLRNPACSLIVGSPSATPNELLLLEGHARVYCSTNIGGEPPDRIVAVHTPTGECSPPPSQQLQPSQATPSEEEVAAMKRRWWRDKPSHTPYWSGPDDPAYAVVTVEVDRAEWSWEPQSGHQRNIVVTLNK
ncbi:hypothetical protein PAPYR_2004 [Paratrimastix pyriformis]|uniref:Pyridoxamine 5'-phosphate oxidase N-terminal domain-containing protein n=1 Tax=Paratrimastix pyriformis TaxID=342808 RepID=A0ABQ8UV52_9EUKA|nr:hypothetical protein PAPYR_2004 [Paratrimastix pyriformis]